MPSPMAARACTGRPVRCVCAGGRPRTRGRADCPRCPGGPRDGRQLQAGQGVAAGDGGPGVARGEHGAPSAPRGRRTRPGSRLGRISGRAATPRAEQQGQARAAALHLQPVPHALGDGLGRGQARQLRQRLERLLAARRDGRGRRRSCSRWAATTRRRSVVEVSVEEGRESRPERVGTSRPASIRRRASELSRSASRARDSRLFTVPSGKPRLSATCSHAQALHLAQQQDGPVLERQPAGAPPAPRAAPRAVAALRRDPGRSSCRLAQPRLVGGGQLLERPRAVLPPPPPPALPVVALVHHDPVDPGLQAAAPFEPRQLAVHLEEDVLRDVPRLLGIAGQPQGQVEDHALVQGHQAGEGVGVARAALRDEAAVRNRRGGGDGGGWARTPSDSASVTSPEATLISPRPLSVLDTG